MNRTGQPKRMLGTIRRGDIRFSRVVAGPVTIAAVCFGASQAFWSIKSESYQRSLCRRRFEMKAVYFVTALAPAERGTPNE